MTKNDEKKDILLEAGTNELEIVEFSIGDALYGINIAKVREIIKADISLVSVPDTHKSIDGAINLRGKIIPIINLARHLNESHEFDKIKNRIIISEFNQQVVGFLVTSVAKIHRLSWKQVEQPTSMLQTNAGYAVGIIKIDNKVLFLLDFEKIASHINPKAGIHPPHESDFVPEKLNIKRYTKNILVVEDSDFIREMIVGYLEKAGYKTTTASNGEQAWDIIHNTIKAADFSKISNNINLVITDIEMPQMDGLHLIKKIKEEPKTREVPCIAFSSMISPELSEKCKSVGSDGEIAKPQIEQLVNLVDNKVI